MNKKELLQRMQSSPFLIHIKDSKGNYCCLMVRSFYEVLTIYNCIGLIGIEGLANSLIIPCNDFVSDNADGRLFSWESDDISAVVQFPKNPFL